jgi:antitoxin ParD1/3/4
MPTRNVNLTDHYDEFVQNQVVVGRYKNASEVMRAGLRLLEQQANEDEAKLTLLRGLAAEGFVSLDNGQGIAIDGERQLADLIGKFGRRAAKRVGTAAGGD